MDGHLFDDVIRAFARSRRSLLGLGAAAGVAPFLADAKKRKKKKKKTVPCQRQCSGRTCGPDGCGGSCGACTGELVCTAGACQCPAGEEACGAECCDTCQACDDARQVCIMKPGSDATSCAGGSCCGGACCPPTCQCGVPGLSGALADFLADILDLPFPACFAPGTGQSCGSLGGTCPAGTTCQIVNTQLGVGICVGLCPGVDYPKL